MNKSLGIFRLFLAVLGAAALVTDLYTSYNHTLFSVVTFFSYFTILSNMFAVVVFAVGGLDLVQGKADSLPGNIRGAALVYMLTTGIIYTLLLSAIPSDTIPWVNTVLHYILPTLILFDWFIDLPSMRLSYHATAWWLVFPTLYIFYTLLHGFDTGWYPYPFLTPSNGYLNIVFAVVGIGFLLEVLGLLTVLSTRLRLQRTS